MKYKLGKNATDRITGFTGTLCGYAKYLTGCDQYLVIPKTDDTTKYPEGQWLDENRLIVFDELSSEEKEIIERIDSKNDPGACGVAPKY